MRDKAGEDAVASAVADAIRSLLALDAGRHYHVEAFGEELADHGRRARRIVGGIAVDQDVDVGFDVVEHPPHHVTFALIGFASHDGAGAARHLHGLVGRIVVVDIDRRRRQRRTKISDHLGDRMLFVVARHQDRHLMVSVDHIFGNRYAA